MPKARFLPPLPHTYSISSQSNRRICAWFIHCPVGDCAAMPQQGPALALYHHMQPLFSGHCCAMPCRTVDRQIGSASWQPLNGIPKVCVIIPARLIPHLGAIHIQNRARSPLTHLMNLHQVRHYLPLDIGRHRFFASRSRTRALSSIYSANSLFSFAFSPSNARNLLAPNGSIPPYFDLYL